MLDHLQRLRPVRVLIVDDTRTVRALIRTLLHMSPQIEVVGEAADPYEARELIRATNPDVITLDVMMPRMNGLDFLEKLMRLRPTPVVMVSTRTTENSQVAIRALSLGAVECVDLAQLRQRNSETGLAETVLIAANSNVRAIPKSGGTSHTEPQTEPFDWNGKSVVIGSSTGGVDALLTVIGAMPADCPPTVIAQHMPANFLASFAARLNKQCPPKVVLASDGDRLSQGKVYLSPGGDFQTRIATRDRMRIENCHSDGSEPYVPSVNQLFSSVEPHAKQVIAVMLTGMGRDGAEAMLRLKNKGAHTIVQDAGSAVIDGMPGAARKLGAACDVAPLNEIGARILQAASRINTGGIS